MSHQENSTKWYSVVFSRRWVSYFLIVVVFATACVGLALWQFDRRSQAQEEIERILNNYNSSPISLTQALPDLSSFDEDLKWQPVFIQGEYLEEEQLLVRARPREGQAGVEVLSPLKTPEGNIFIVNRGWLPLNTENNTSYDMPQPPRGQVEVIARLKAGEPGIPGREQSEGQVATIELPIIASILEMPTYTGAYGEIASENPSPSETPPLPPLEPTLDEGAHLSYALQWIMFGILGFVALVWAIRNELKIRRGTPQKKRKNAAPTEEEIVDALLDAKS